MTNINSQKSIWKGSNGPLLIAEIGGNHEGDFEKAKMYTKLAIESGVDCIKFQLYKGDTLVNAIENPQRNKHFKKFELSKEENIYLAQMCKKANIIYNASVWDIEMLNWIDPYLDFYKVGSGDMTAWPIISEFAIRNKPILLSTGLSTMNEVIETVDYIQSININYCDPSMLCIMQCTSMYPIPDSEANLSVMNKFKNLTGLSVGYSDHTIGTEALKIATAMGANVLEFHFTDSREGKKFRDHKVSLTIDEVKLLSQQVNKITEFLGDGEKKLQKSEIRNNHNISFRRGVYLNKKIKKGSFISFSDLVFLRPNHGTHSKDYNLIVGAKALKDLFPLEPIADNVHYKK
tara:strand:+ start:13033 stop:14073 length:1041 start_codon:yes stop_codon:yes gene_type:complete